MSMTWSMTMSSSCRVRGRPRRHGDGGARERHVSETRQSFLFASGSAGSGVRRREYTANQL